MSTQRWVHVAGISLYEGRLDGPAYVEDFLDEIEAVCKKHGLSISHEDSGGSFMLSPFDPHDVEWLRAASLEIPMADWKPSPR